VAKHLIDVALLLTIHKIIFSVQIRENVLDLFKAESIHCSLFPDDSYKQNYEEKKKNQVVLGN
jgi:hypothetical protein